MPNWWQFQKSVHSVILHYRTTTITGEHDTLLYVRDNQEVPFSRILFHVPFFRHPSSTERLSPQSCIPPSRTIQNKCVKNMAKEIAKSCQIHTNQTGQEVGSGWPTHHSYLDSRQLILHKLPIAKILPISQQLASYPSLVYEMILLTTRRSSQTPPSIWNG
jgi:hypothetical protein